jgi:hypothetical protein
MGHPVGNTKQFSLMKHFLCMTILLTIGKIVDHLRDTRVKNSLWY